MAQPVTDNELLKQPDLRKVIVFNGPPGCGKDTAAEYTRSYVQVNAQYLYPRHMKFAEPLKKAAHALFAAFHGWDYYDDKDGRAQKGLSNGDFLGLSPREAYIAMHEQVLKPLFGGEALGHILRKRIIREYNAQLIVLSDSGFIEELAPIVNLVGERNLMFVELHRADTTFEGDSRKYIGDEVAAKWPKATVKKLINPDGDKAFFKLLCEGLCKNFLKIEDKE